jgi:N-acyl-D-amino-acid deacylase
MKFILSILILFSLQNCFAQQADIIIKNGKIIDGAGNSWFYADVAIKAGKIILIQKDIQLKAATIIDAKGLIVAPGFIDVHTHIEDDEVKNPLATNFIYDGVTTVVTGNCGLSRIDLKKYFHLIDSIKLSINVASMIGHNDIREFVMGKANREPTAIEMQKMENIVTNAMKAGAVGFSTGLIYTPGNYSKTDEIIKLAKIAAQYNGVYATHMRSEGDSISYAIEEALNIGRTCNMPVEISHFKLSGQNNWGRGKETLGLVKTAREQGLDEL